MSDKPFLSDAQRWARAEEDIRRLKLKKGHTVDRSIIVGNTELLPGLWIGQLRVGVDVDDDTPEAKYLIGFCGQVQVGTLDVAWKLNGTTITGADSHVITTTADQFPVTLATPVELESGDRIRPDIIDNTGLTQGLEATVLMIAVPI